MIEVGVQWIIYFVSHNEEEQPSQVISINEFDLWGEAPAKETARQFNKLKHNAHGHFVAKRVHIMMEELTKEERGVV